MYEPIFRIMQNRHPLPRGQRIPTIDEIVVSLYNGLKNRISRAWNYDRGVDEGYAKAENPAEKAENTAYLMAFSKPRT